MLFYSILTTLLGQLAIVGEATTAFISSQAYYRGYGGPVVRFVAWLSWQFYDYCPIGYKGKW